MNLIKFAMSAIPIILYSPTVRAQIGYSSKVKETRVHSEFDEKRPGTFGIVAKGLSVCGHPSLPFGAIVKVNQNGKTAYCMVTDRVSEFKGSGDATIDLSKTVHTSLGNPEYHTASSFEVVGLTRSDGSLTFDGQTTSSAEKLSGMSDSDFQIWKATVTAFQKRNLELKAQPSKPSMSTLEICQEEWKKQKLEINQLKLAASKKLQCQPDTLVPNQIICPDGIYTKSNLSTGGEALSSETTKSLEGIQKAVQTILPATGQSGK